MATIAIAGTHGFLFKPIVEGITSDLFKSKYVLPIKALSRDPASETATEGVEYVKVDYSSPESLQSALKGVHTLIDIIGPNPAVWNAVADAAAAAGVKLYFTSDFGCDYRTLEAKGIKTFLKIKSDHAAYARSKGLKTVQVFTGLFQAFFFYGFFGHDFKAGTATFFGDGSQKVTTTDLKDIGLAVASLGYRDDVPDYVSLSGDTLTLNDSVKLYEKVTGKKLAVSYVDTPPLEPLAAADFDPRVALTTLSAHPETKSFYLEEDSADIVNPGLWKFKTLEEAFKEL